MKVSFCVSQFSIVIYTNVSDLTSSLETKNKELFKLTLSDHSIGVL